MICEELVDLGAVVAENGGFRPPVFDCCTDLEQSQSWLSSILLTELRAELWYVNFECVSTVTVSFLELFTRRAVR